VTPAEAVAVAPERRASAPTKPPPPSTAPQRPGGVAWSTAAGLVIIHVGALAGVAWLLLSFSARTAVLAVVLHVACGLSISAGYHRLFSHRSYRVLAPVRWFFLVFGAGSFQGSALGWAADHRAHHADTDGPADPHAINRGFWWAHTGWLLRPRAASADVTHVKDLCALRSVRAQHRYNRPLAATAGLVLPALIAWTWGDPWGGLLVAGFLRAAVMLQSTFCINSLAHRIGRRTYDRAS
jgi:stearoyl-CoA desaturase (delta-9 desaturase)